MLSSHAAARGNAGRVWAAATLCGVAVWVVAKWRTVFAKLLRHALADIGGHGSGQKPADHGHLWEAEEPTLDLEDLGTQAGEARPDPAGAGQVLQRLRRPAAGLPQAAPAAGGEDWLAESSHLPGRQRVHVKTFGCQHNQSDGEYMMGQLRDYGYTLVESLEECDVCVVNSCTVKTPSEMKGLTVVTRARESGKPVVLAGCVPSGDKKLAESMAGVSMLHVTQLDRIVDVVEESVKGHVVKLLEKRQGLTSLSLPKVRKDRSVEIITINAGCLGNCTYCKTKFARGTVVSYPIDTIIDRAKQAVSEGVCHIELASEDMGAYGVDIGTNIVELLLKLSDALPPGVMVRTGMTNPPYMLHHIEGIAQALARPNVYAFMHIPVQSGSDAVLQAMRREYTVAEFSFLVDKLKAAVPDIYLLTDIICGFPAESVQDWEATMALARKYKFHGIYSSKFFARPGTPAARLKKLKEHVSRDRYKELVEFGNSYNRNQGLEGREVRVWFSGTQEEHQQTVGRTKAFAKVVVKRDDALLGRSAMVRVLHTRPQDVEGQVIGDLL